MLKSIYLIAAILLTGLTIQAQNNKAGLQQDLTIFLGHTKTLDIEKILDYTNPKLFKFVPREAMVEALATTFDNTDIALSMENLKFEDIYPLLANDEGNYALVDYTGSIVMTMKDEAIDEEGMETMMNIFVMQYGEDMVSKEDKTFTIDIEKTMIAYYPVDAEHWYFVEQKPEMQGLLDMMIGKKMQKALNKSKYTKAD